MFPCREFLQSCITLAHLTGLRIGDTPVQAVSEKRLGFNHDGADLAFGKITFFLQYLEQAFVPEVALAEIPSQCHGRDHLAVDIGIFLKRISRGCLRQYKTQNAALQVHGAESEVARAGADRVGWWQEFLELFELQGGDTLDSVELLVAVTVEQPGIPGPVARVVAHREKKGDG